MVQKEGKHAHRRMWQRDGGAAIIVVQMRLIWLNADELIVTDNINGDVFDEPVAEDLCSEVVVNVTNNYGDGAAPCPWC